MLHSRYLISGLLIALSFFSLTQLRAAPTIHLEDISGARFKEPILARQHPEHKNSWYVAERGGKIIKWEPGKSNKIFLELDKRLNSTRHGESGLLGFDFDPLYPQRPFVYISYTSHQNGFASRISRIKCCNNKGQLDLQSEILLLEVKQPYGNHNGGHIVFGPDGFLYIGLGDGGSGGDPQGHAQNRSTLLGNILRIDVANLPYTIPPTNPFSNTNYRKEIFAWGLRNPWRFHFYRHTGKLWAGDVGQNQWEEINIIESGKNYGWNIMEGNHCYRKLSCKRKKITLPLSEYSQERGDKSITGGYVYRGKRIKHLYEKYLFGDFVSGRIFSISQKKASPIDLLLQSPYHISSFAQDLNNELYILAYYQGKLLRITSP